MPSSPIPERIELTLLPDGPDVSAPSDREGLLNGIRDAVGFADGENISVVDVYPRGQKLLVEVPGERADELLDALGRGRLERLGVVDAYVGPRAPSSESDLDFDRRPMVRWFDPIELVRAGVKALVSSLFGSYADQREVQAVRAALRGSLATRRHRKPDRSDDETSTREKAPLDMEEIVADEVRDYSDRTDVWIDYVADLGDGWDPTYSIARLLAEDELTVPHGESYHTTRRGNVLVMGGDQVYPTAKREEYRDRMVGPYRSALPAVLGDESPDLFAIPGNHDWYDGLTSFTRLFCQQRWIGGWKTRQERSYFAVRLPHDWWLWGIDVQLDSDIDLPQFEYFQTLARHMKAGSDVVLCTAEPSWVYSEQKGREAYQNLEYFERKIIRENDLNLAVALAGDLHNYARYEERSDSDAGADGGSTRRESAEEPTAETRPRQRIVSGGGGAYLYPSHQMPSDLALPDADPSPTPSDAEKAGDDHFELKGVFPDPDTSKRTAWYALLLPFKNIQFAGVLGAFYLLFAWLMQSWSKMITEIENSFLTTLEGLPYLSATGFEEVWWECWTIVRHSPATAAIVLLLLIGLIGFADKKGVWKVVLGFLHTVVHLTAALVLIWTFAELNLGVFGLSDPDAFSQVLLFTGEMLVLGGLVGGVIFGAYLILTNRLLHLDRSMKRSADATPAGGRLRGVHANEVFSCQSIPDYKNFLRLHVREDGDLVIYPFGIEEVGTRWRFRPDAGSGQAWFETLDRPIVDRAELIEEPIVVSRS